LRMWMPTDIQARGKNSITATYVFVLRVGSTTQTDLRRLREEVKESLEGLAACGYRGVDLAMGAYATAVKLATRHGMRVMELVLAVARGVLRRFNVY